jgi:methylated-DNA-protein-cysteine methyltransferase related protein
MALTEGGVVINPQLPLIPQAACMLPMVSDFTARALAVIRQIPSGKVVTYGMVAVLAGNPRAARQVGWLLHSLSERHRLPWHRVVNRQGAISPRTEGDGNWQRALLAEEGVVFSSDGRIDLQESLWRPTAAIPNI